MKARLLNKLLNNTGYKVHSYDNHICIGSGMSSRLMTMDMKTFKLNYSLDTFNEGRAALKNDELLFIWDKLSELAVSGEINDIINGDDELEINLPVFTVEDGVLKETITDSYGWPNVTISGELMYSNTWFKTKEEAIQYGIKDMEYAIKHTQESIARHEVELQQRKVSLDKYQKKQNELLQMQSLNS